MIKKIICLALIGLFTCCKTSDDRPDCSAVSCLAPSIIINLVDNVTKENSILKNNITEENITIQDASESLINFTLNETNGLLLANKRKSDGVFTLLINSEIIADISYDTSTPKTNECCDFGNLINVFVEDKEFTIENEVITIYL